MKKFLTLTAVAAVALSLAACTKTETTNTTVVETNATTEELGNDTFGNEVAVGNDVALDSNTTELNTTEGNAL